MSYINAPKDHLEEPHKDDIQRKSFAWHKPIDSFAMTTAREDLWRHVLNSSTECIRLGIFVDRFFA